MSSDTASPGASDLRHAIEHALETRDAVVFLSGRQFEGSPRNRALRDRFGAERVLVGPDDPAALLGLARGLAAGGRHPLVDLAPADTLGLAFETLAREIASARFRSAGAFPLPMTLLLPPSAAPGGGPDLSRSPESWLAGLPGLRVLAASAATPAAALLETALAGADPTVVIGTRAAALDESPTETGFRARILRRGDAATLIAYGDAVQTALEAADAARATGREIEVVDLVSLAPLDTETILAAAAKTGRVVVVQNAPRRGGVAAEIVALVAERAVEYLEAPVLRVAAPESPAPVRRDEHHRPDPARVLRAVEQVMDF